MTESTEPAITLRPYQVAAVKAIYAEFRRQPSTLLVLPTGTGKTATAGEIVRAGYAAGRRILMLAHRAELITQTAATLGRMAGCEVQVEMAERAEASNAGSLFAAGTGRVVVASVQSIVRRLHRFPEDAFDLVIVDECHHATAVSYAKILTHFARAKLLGVTATPERGDKVSLSKVFASVAFDLTLADAITDGWLVPIRQVLVKTGIDFSAVRTRAGDFAASDLSEVMRQLDSLREASVALVRNLGPRQALVFCVDVAHVVVQTESIREVMRETGVAGRVEMVVGETPSDVRESVFAAFRAGDVKVLVNCEIATEGTDLPSCDLVAMFRPTKSRTLYSQMRGRGLRPLPGCVDGVTEASDRRKAIAASPKPDLIVLDLVGNFDRHASDVVDCLDDLMDDDDPDAQEARRILARGDTDDLMKALEMARALRFGRDRARLACDGDFFAIFGIVRDSDRWGRKVTDKQRAALESADVPLVGIDRRSANQAISLMIERRYDGLATYKQARALVKWGVPLEVVESISFEAASRAMTNLQAQGWKPRDGSWWRETVGRSDGLQPASRIG